MEFDKIKNKGQAQLFKSPVLEAFTKTNPIVIWSMYIPIMAYMLYRASTQYGFSTSKVWLTWLGGLLFWSFFEYIAHRYLFHLKSDSPAMKRFSYILHGNHHEYPRDRQRLFMPPVPSIILATIIFSIMYLIMGNTAFMFFPGFILGYLLYGTIHYAIHAWNPPFKWMKPLWRNHHLHHYKHADKGFGVSSTLWDLVFGTMYDLKKEKEDTEKVKELMFK
jgi:sterol desaturase/sphingolipid hydroxylase (fatty acid hydroxylase superfamily)